MSLHLVLLCVLVAMLAIDCQQAALQGRRVLVVAGNFTLDGERTNIAQFDIHSGVWTSKYQAEVFLFGEDNGAIRDIAVNYTDHFDSLYAVGLFDTVTKISQIQLCSVAKFDGLSFGKVGEGLCYRGMDSASILLDTVVLGNGGDLFVGGNFETRVWNGRHFVSIFHVARYDALTSAWLPLSGVGELKAKSLESTQVNALAWDGLQGVLYIGGYFDAVGNRTIPAGLAMWSVEEGLMPFSGGGIFAGGDSGVAQALVFDAESKSLFVAGKFDTVGNISCSNVAVWNSVSNGWRCLFQRSVSFSSVSAVLLLNYVLYLSGPVSEIARWKSSEATHTIARLNLRGYVDEIVAATLAVEDAQHTATNSGLTETTVKSRRGLRYLPMLSSGSDSDFPPTNGMGDWISGFGHYHSNTKKKDSNSTIIVTSRSPTAAPTVIVQPWTPLWEWLPGFEGTNGPVLKLSAGRRVFENMLLISGQFSNMPPLLLWQEVVSSASSQHTGNITLLGGRHDIQGMISAIAEVQLPFDLPPPVPRPQPQYSRDYTFIILLACVGVGVLLGLGFTIGCFTKLAYPHSEDLAIYEASDPMSSLGQLSLKTLSDGHGSVAVDFRDCFERAMKIRHLPAYEALVIINPKEIILSRIIGEGSFGRVWSGQWRNNSVAVKEFVFAQAAIAGGSLQRNNIIEEIVGEAGVMACLRHPKILQLYGCSLTMQAIWIVSELCARGSLKMLLVDQLQELTIAKKLSICMDVADGMQYLHNRSPPIIHRDLKSHNIFISEPSPGHFVAKIGDWGSARAVALTGQKNMTHGVGTACWLSPEVINNAHFSKFSDVYAFGIILWEVFTRQEIYEGLSAAQIIAKVANDGLRPNIPRECPWNKIMTDCWKQDPVGRPNFQTILIALSKIYLTLNTNRKSRNMLGLGMVASEEEAADGEGFRETQPLLATPSVDGCNVRYDSLLAGQITPSRPILPAQLENHESPDTLAARKRIREFNMDCFHPSMENNAIHRASLHGSVFSNLIEESPAHLAPEIARQELANAPAFIVADDAGMQLVIATDQSDQERKSGDGRAHYSGEIDEDADPIDFLFASHQTKRSPRGNTNTTSQPVQNKTKGPNAVTFSDTQAYRR